MFLQRGDSSAVHDMAVISTRGVARFASERRAARRGARRGPEHGVWGPGGVLGVAEGQQRRVELRAIELWRGETW